MVNIKVDICGNVRPMWLPVMDHKNNAIQNPDQRKISDTRMRALTKCLALFGLGHYIYAGEDLPEAVTKKVVDKTDLEGLQGMIEQTGTDLKQLLQWIGTGIQPGIKDLADLLESNYATVESALSKKVEAMKAAQAAVADDQGEAHEHASSKVA